ncbi:MAG: DUF4397 domain-containing protein [Pseudomonadota bacterium]
MARLMLNVSHSFAWLQLMARASGLVKRSLYLVAATAGLAMAGCTDTPDEPDGEGAIRGIHAIAGLSDVAFLIEEVSIGNATYQTATPFTVFDSLVYDFNFDFTSPVTGERTRLATAELSVRPGQNYTFVLGGTTSAPTLRILEQTTRVFDAGGSVLELWFGNLSTQIGSIDIYVGAPGFDPAAAMPLASALDSDSFSGITEVEASEVEFVATRAGDPADILIRSQALTLLAGDTSLVNLYDAADETTGEYAFVISGDLNGARLVDQTAPTQLQFIHASQPSPAVDVFVGDTLGTPVVSNLTFGMISDVLVIPEADDATEVTLISTPTGQPGTELTSDDASFSDASTNLLVITGAQADDTLGVASSPRNRRPLTDAARLGLFNAIQNTELIDVFVLEPDEMLEGATPRGINVGPSLDLTQSIRAPGDYVLYITNSDDDSVLLGPMAFSLAAGDIRQLVFVDTVDPNVPAVIDFDLRLP